MAIVESSGLHHVRLTVTDIGRSKAFYDQLFGWPIVADQSAHVDEPGVNESPDQVYGGVVYQSPSGVILGLRPVGNEPFDSSHTGLDHISFSVASRDDLVATEKALDEAGIVHGETRDLAGFGLAILSLSDPDGVHLELSAPLG